MKKWLTFLALLCLKINLACAQSSEQWERVLEILDIDNEDVDDSELLSTLEYFYDHPININTISTDSLRMLGLMSEPQIENLLTFRLLHGSLADLSELLLVSGFNESDLDLLTPFLTVEGYQYRYYHRPPSNHFRHEILTRFRRLFPRQEGYRTSNEKGFLGSPYASTIRYKGQNAKWQVGTTLENDAGEPLFAHRRSVDFKSAYLSYSSDNRLRCLLLGDFKVSWGQGLVAWTAYSMGKSANGQGLEKIARLPAVYTSINESGYLRGMAVVLQVSQKSRIEAFASHKWCDGSRNLDGSISLSTIGYHRTFDELKKWHAVRQSAFGAAWTFNSHQLRFGAHALYYHFSSPLVTDNFPYRRYADDGQHRLLMGLDYRLNVKGVALAGEWAVSELGRWAMLHTARRDLWSGAVLNVLWRYFDKQYQSYFARGFSEYSGTTNEEGVFARLDWVISSHWQTSVFYDRFNFFAPRYQAVIPRCGDEVGIDLKYEHKSISHQFRFRCERHPESLSSFQYLMRRRISARYRFLYDYAEQWSFRTTIESSYYHKQQTERGVFLAQDVIYSSVNKKFMVQIRMAYFDTDSYQSRIYASEHNPLYMNGFYSFYNQGVRGYVNAAYDVYEKIKISLKGGWLHYCDQSEISSGLTYVKGKNSLDATIQIRYKF